MNKILVTLSFLISLICMSSQSWGLKNCPTSRPFNNCYGSFTWENGNKYIGEWKDNKKSGQGSIILKDGTKIYEGEFKDGLINGQGTMNYPNGDKYSGEWKDADFFGKGTFTRANGNKYIGNWRGNKKFSGEKYISKFKDKNEEKREIKNNIIHNNPSTLAKGILNTLTKTKITKEEEETKIKENIESDKKKVLDSIRKIVGNSNKHNKIKESNKNLKDNVRNYKIVVMNHISKNWNLSYGFSKSKIKIFPMKVHLNSNGDVVDIEYVGENSPYSSNIERSIINSIKRAIQKSSPLPIPKDKRINFEKLKMYFNTNLLTPK